MDTLIDDSDSVLVVVDAQPGFLRKLPSDTAAALVERIAWLVGVAGRLGVPIVVTEEQPGVHGATEPAIVDELAAGTRRWEKPTFGLAFTPEIHEAISAHERRTVVVCGLETDVCVAQSAIGLVDLGWKVAVVRDACGAPNPAHPQGLERMDGAGVMLVGLKGLYYEWIRSVDRLGSVEGLPTSGPSGITL